MYRRSGRPGKRGAALQERLEPSQGRRRWVHHPKVPMSEETVRKLAQLAERWVSPMQVAAQLLEAAVAGCGEVGA